MVTSASSIQTRINIPALSIIQQMNRTNSALGINLERLSTGLRINRASDDVGGLVIRDKLRTQFRALNQASANAQDAYNMANTADEALNQFITNLQTLRDKAQEASSSSTTVSERIALQSEVEDLLDELNRIAQSTSFGGKKLLNGSIGNQTGFVDSINGRLGASLSFGPAASTLETGRSFLNIIRTQDGSASITAGATAGFNTGLKRQTDIAVSVAQFLNPPALAADADRLRDLTFNGASLNANDTFTISGVLADGSTQFTGTITISNNLRLDNGAGSFVDKMQQIIDAAETAAGYNGTGKNETSVTYNATSGRLEFSAVEANQISQFQADFTAKNATANTKTTSTTTRAGSILHEEISVTNTAKIGNSFTAITGSTFNTGEFTIEILSVTAAQNRTIQTNFAFYDPVTSNVASLGRAIGGTSFNGVTIANTDVITFDGVNADGTTFSSAYTVQAAADGVAGNGLVRTYQDLIDELNYRDQTATTNGFNDATTTLASTGFLQVIDDVAQTGAQTSFTFTVDTATPISESSNTIIAGNAEQALIQIDGGTSQTVEAGQVVTLEGTQDSDGRTPQVTFRVGSNFSVGTDTLKNTADTYQGTLNGGTAVTFQAGDQDVLFQSGPRGLSADEPYQYLTLDFDSFVNVTADAASGGQTFILSSVSRELTFYLGALEDKEVRFTLGDLRTNQLGLSSDNMLADIDVTTVTGANSALDVIDAAIEQATLVQAQAGSVASRLSAATTSLDTESENIQTAEARISNADIAQETTELTTNTLLLNVQAAILAQANLYPSEIAGILLGLNK